MAAALLICIPRPITAGELTTPRVGREAAADLVWHTGLIGIFDREKRNAFSSLEARLRWNWHGLRPWTGLTVVDSGAWFTGAGLIYDFAVSSRCRLTFGSGPFYYSHVKQGDDLGFDLEFYSFVETTWLQKNDTRFGLRLGHLSNAGLSRKNPGTETLSLVVSIPLGRRHGASARF